MPLGIEKDLQRRTRILSVTRRLVSERGYNNITLSDIAKASGVTVQTLYNRFNSKDELLASAVAEYYQIVIGKAERTAEGSGITKLLHIIYTITVELSKERDYAREMSNIF